MSLPDYLKQGEVARLFPVLATTSKEGRTTSIFLSCLARIDEFGEYLLTSLGHRVGKRTKIECFTEVVFQSEKKSPKDRPDGLIVCRNGSKEWRVLVEAKVGNATLDDDQIERYRSIAKDAQVDCVVTISNQFTSSPQIHPMASVRKSRSRIPVYHWSWMTILTATDLLLSNNDVADADQVLLLNELRRFLSHESAGVKGFDRMPPEWAELNKLVSAGGRIPLKSADAAAVASAWHQETRDLSLILTRQTEVLVTEVLSRKLAKDGALRERATIEILSQDNCLLATLQIPDAAAPIDIRADIVRRTIDVGMSLKAPEDKVSTKARVNWILRQIKSERTADLNIRLLWLGRGEDTLFSYDQLANDPSIAEEGKEGQQVRRFDVFYARRLGARFTQQANFITDLEEVVPSFYREIGQGLSAWRKAAPRIKEDRATSEDVSVEAIEDDAESKTL